jgi:hypothetical protein
VGDSVVVGDVAAGDVAVGAGSGVAVSSVDRVAVLDGDSVNETLSFAGSKGESASSLFMDGSNLHFNPVGGCLRLTPLYPTTDAFVPHRRQEADSFDFFKHR